MRQHIICGIDIGNTSIKTIIGEINRELGRPQIIGIASVPSNGLRRGVVVDMEETTNNIRDSVNLAQSMAGVKVDRAYVSINGLHIRTQLSHGIIAVSRADGEISQYDIERVIDAASAVSLPANREIIHVIPRNFILDGQERVKNALGMKGVRLEADVLLIEGLSPYVRNLARCVNANNIEVAEFVFGPIATAKAVLDKHQLEHGVLSIDFGGGVSTVTLFHEGELVHTATLPIGSRHITNDIAIALRTSMDKAEEVKCQYGYTGNDEVLAKDQIDLSRLLGDEELILPRKQIAKIVDARVSELFDMIGNEVKKIHGSYLLPAGVVLSGGGANLNGLEVATKNRLRLAVKTGQDANFVIYGNFKDNINDPALATAIGLMVWGFEKEFSGKPGYILNSIGQDRVNKAIRWFKNFLP